jgi:pimeloyl-ACP methyl ester carboxylesterase
MNRSLEVLSRPPSGPARPTPLLFVHGAWHAAWCWDENFLPYFAERGYAVHALSLRGHGASEGRGRLRWLRVADYVADVAQVASSLPATPVVIGHSMGGFVVQKYLERNRPRAAVLLAPLPPAGALGVTLRLAARHPLAFLKSNLTWRLWPLVATPALAREAFLSASTPDARVQEIFARLQDESYRAFLDLLVFDLPRTKLVETPMLVLGADKDTIFTPAEIAATARAYGAESGMFPHMAHDMMLEGGWEAVAEKILAWLQGRGL